MVEERAWGIKSRQINECPGAPPIMADADLEGLTWNDGCGPRKARSSHVSPSSSKTTDRVLSHSRQAMSAFMTSTQRCVTARSGYPLQPGGGAEVVGRRSPVGLYVYDSRPMNAAERLPATRTGSFVRLFGLGIQTWSARQGGAE